MDSEKKAWKGNEPSKPEPISNDSENKVATELSPESDAETKIDSKRSSTTDLSTEWNSESFTESYTDSYSDLILDSVADINNEMIIESDSDSHTRSKAYKYSDDNNDTDSETKSKMVAEPNSEKNRKPSDGLINESNVEGANAGSGAGSGSGSGSGSGAGTVDTNVFKIKIANPFFHTNTAATNTIKNTAFSSNPDSNSPQRNSNELDKSAKSIDSNDSDSINLNMKRIHHTALIATKNTNGKRDESETESHSSASSHKRSPDNTVEKKAIKSIHVAEPSSPDSEEESYPHHLARVGDRHQAVVSSFDSSVAQQTQQVRTTYEKIWDPTRLSESDLDAFVGLFPADALETVYDVIAEKNYDLDKAYKEVSIRAVLYF